MLKHLGYDKDGKDIFKDKKADGNVRTTDRSSPEPFQNSTSVLTPRRVIKRLTLRFPLLDKPVAT